MLRSIKAMDIQQGIVTSKIYMTAHMALSWLPHEISFKPLVTGSDIGVPLWPKRGKPSPDTLLWACATHGYTPRETIYVGDMAVDAAAAYEANIDFYWASWGYCDKMWYSDLTILNKPSSLPEIIKGLKPT
jgi:phosphoglycolate phosphatase-like HAD superfamily hydrolase